MTDVSVTFATAAYVDWIAKKYGAVAVEHGIDAPLVKHEFWLTIPDYTAFTRLVVLHPAACGCDALTNELVLHG